MDHVAIMRKRWGLLPKILTGEKTIESRWYKFRHSPWGSITKGDTVYFKNSGEPVTISAKVKDVKQFDNLTTEKVKNLLKKYSRNDGIEKDTDKYYEMFKDKHYCILIFLENSQLVEKPFEINKKGFGAMAAWICVSDIDTIKIP